MSGYPSSMNIVKSNRVNWCLIRSKIPKRIHQASILKQGLARTLGKTQRKTKKKLSLTQITKDKGIEFRITGFHLFFTLFTVIRTVELEEHFKKHKGWKYIPYPVFTSVFKQIQDEAILGTKHDTHLSYYFHQIWSGIWDLLLPTVPELRRIDRKKIGQIHLKKLFGGFLMRGCLGCKNYKDLYGLGPEPVKYSFFDDLLPRNLVHELCNNLQLDDQLMSTIHQVLTSNFKRLFVPGTYLTIDEIRIPCRHFKCAQKKYNVKKPDVWAVESKSLNDLCGYLYDFTDPFTAPVQNYIKDAVSKLVNSTKSTGRRHVITLDSNFLNAEQIPTLTSDRLKIHAMCKKKSPAYLFADGLGKELPRSYTRVAASDHYIAAVTFNNGFCNLASSAFTVENNPEKYNHKERRTLLKFYDSTKGSSDNFGQLVKSYWPNQRCLNWKMTVLLGWFMYAVTNSYIIVHLRNPDQLHRDYIYKLSRELLASSQK